MLIVTEHRKRLLLACDFRILSTFRTPSRLIH